MYKLKVLYLNWSWEIPRMVFKGDDINKFIVVHTDVSEV